MYSILALDGGGERGIIEGTAVKGLPSINYDLLAGTSAGSINVALLATGRTPDDIINFYAGPEAKEVFKPYFLPLHSSKYNSDNVQDVMARVFGDTKLGDLKTNILITSYDLTNRKAVLFSNINEEHKPLFLRDVVLASAAAPYYFTPHSINGSYYTDGGIICNNPSMCAYSFVKERFNITDPLIISIGTGNFEQSIQPQDFCTLHPIAFIMNILDAFMDGNQEMVDIEARNLIGENYIRFQVDLPEVESAIDNVKLDNIQGLIDLTNKYINNEWKSSIDFLKTKIQTTI